MNWYENSSVIATYLKATVNSTKNVVIGPSNIKAPPKAMFPTVDLIMLVRKIAYIQPMAANKLRQVAIRNITNRI